MPPALIKNFIDLAMTGKRKIQKAAFVVDIRGGQFFGDLKETIISLEDDINIDFKILFIEASDEALIRRFNEARRTHPLAASLMTREAIQIEREKLAELRSHANYVIDTSSLKVAEMNSELDKLFGSKTKKASFVLNLMSFGYKHGMPAEADWVIDVRFIPNPYYVSSLKKLGKQQKTRPVCDEAGYNQRVCQPFPRDHSKAFAMLCQRRKIQSHHSIWLYRRPAQIGGAGKRIL